MTLEKRQKRDKKKKKEEQLQYGSKGIYVGAHQVKLEEVAELAEVVQMLVVMFMMFPLVFHYW